MPHWRPARLALPAVKAQIHPCGDHLDAAFDAVAAQQGLHLPAGGHDAGRPAANPPGEGGDHVFAHPHAGGEVVGVVLIHRVVGVYNGHPQAAGDGVGHPEGAELALGVDHVRTPRQQLLKKASVPVNPQAGPGVDPVGADRAHIVNAVRLIRMQTVGQGDHPHLVSLLLQLPLQEQHRRHHAVDDRRVPIRCNQYFHSAPFRKSRLFRCPGRMYPDYSKSPRVKQAYFPG